MRKEYENNLTKLIEEKFDIEMDKFKINNFVLDLLENKDKEIERLNKEIKEYQEELAKADSITQSCIFEGKEEATKSYRECLNLLERLHSIIKEVLDKKEELMYLASKCSVIYKNDIEVVGIYDRLKELFEILEKENRE